MKNKPIKAILTAGILLASFRVSAVAQDTNEDAATASRRFRASATAPIGNFVKNTDILVNSIKGNRLRDGTVSGSKLINGSVTGVKLDLSQDDLSIGGNLGVGGGIETGGNALFGLSDNTAVGFDATVDARLGFIKQFGRGPVIASASGNPIIFAVTNQDEQRCPKFALQSGI